MSENYFGELETSIQAKLESDTDFQFTLETLSDEDKEQVIKDKKTELFNAELAQLKKNEELAKNYKIRAEKVEQELKKLKPEVKETKPQEKSELLQKDLIALVRANIHDDDIEVVEKFAKGYGIPLAEALKSDDLKAILDRKAEIRKSAENANTGSTKKATPKLSDQDILNKASKGEIPEKGSEEAEKLFWARRGGKR